MMKVMMVVGFINQRVDYHMACTPYTQSAADRSTIFILILCFSGFIQDGDKRSVVVTMALSTETAPVTTTLKSISVGKDPGAVGLSRSWRVVKKHQGIYSGGKVGEVVLSLRAIRSSSSALSSTFHHHDIHNQPQNQLSFRTCNDGQPPFPYAIMQIQLSPTEEYVACLFGSDVVFANTKNGQVIKTLSMGEGEVSLLTCLPWPQAAL